MCVFLISPVPITKPLTSELIDTPVFYNLAPRPIKYRVSVPIPSPNTAILFGNYFTICDSWGNSGSHQQSWKLSIQGPKKVYWLSASQWGKETPPIRATKLCRELFSWLSTSQGLLSPLCRTSTSNTAKSELIKSSRTQITLLTVSSLYCHLASASGAWWQKLRDWGGASSLRPLGS